MCCAFLADGKSLLSPRHREDNSGSKRANSVRKLDYQSQLRTRKAAKITACGPCFMQRANISRSLSHFIDFSFFFHFAHCQRMTLSPLQMCFSGKKRTKCRNYLAIFTVENTIASKMYYLCTHQNVLEMSTTEAHLFSCSSLKMTGGKKSEQKGLLQFLEMF